MYEVGDTVKIVGSYVDEVYAGKVATVVEVFPGRPYPYRVKVKGIGYEPLATESELEAK